MKNILLIAFAIITTCGCVSTEQSTINQSKYLGRKKNKSSIYKQASDSSFVSPIMIDGNKCFNENVDKLLVLNILGDEKYRTAEIYQIIHAPDTGAIVYLYKTDNQVDIYTSPFLSVDSTHLASLFNSVTITKSNIYCRINLEDNGLQAKFEMTDRFNHRTYVSIEEDQMQSKPFSTLMPVGSTLAEPAFFRYIYLTDMGIVNRDSSTVSVKFSGRTRVFDNIPYTSYYMTRYSDKPVFAEFNPSYNGKLKSFKGADTIVDGYTRYIMVNNDGHYEIKSITRQGNDNNDIGFVFSPPIPDIVNLNDDYIGSGKFSSFINNIKGTFAGTYSIERTGNEFFIKLKPEEGWQPNPGKLWFKSFTWEARLTVKDSIVRMKSNWIYK